MGEERPHSDVLPISFATLAERLRTEGLAATVDPSAGAFTFTTHSADDRVLDVDLFVAIRGTTYDAHDALDRVVATPIGGVIAETAPPLGSTVPWLQVDDSRRALAILHQMQAGDPGRALDLLGITGTNGKSSTVRILVEILEAAGIPTGWWTTVDRFDGRSVSSSPMTTPGSAALAETLASARDAGARAMVLEVSSHALDQGRIAGLPFRGAALTQISRDHLDYHGDFASYRAAKLRLADARSSGAPWILPATEEFFEGAAGLADPVLWHSTERALDRPGGWVLTRDLTPEGIRATLRLLDDELEITSALRGSHNLENILVAALLARSVGVDPNAIATGIANAQPVAGRLERVPGGPGQVYVDYAHTPDALSAMLGSVRPWVAGRLFVVFGCGGDRDRGKRPQMGAAAARFADHLIVTSDNPRSEDPDRIIADVLAGLPPESSVETESDRRAAIARALEQIDRDDVLVVAGKGHEAEQVIGAEVKPFDDRRVIEALWAERGRDA